MEEGVTPRVAGATAVGSRWREMGVPFLVLHGLEGYPDRLGRDLDALMDQSVADNALREAGEVLGGLGWQTVLPPDTWGKRLVALQAKGRGEFEYLEFHTMGSVQWVVLPLVEPSESASHTIGPFPVSYWATFLKELIAPILAGDTSRYTAEYFDRHVGSSIRIEAIESRCRDYFGKELGGALLQGLEDRDPRRFLENRAPLRRLLIGRMARHPMGSLRQTPAFLKKKAPRTSSGLHVVLETPPTSEMEFVLESLVGKLANVFVEIDVRNKESDRRTASERNRLRARQSLAIDQPTNLALRESGRIRASVSSFGKHPSLDISLEGESLADVTGHVAEWIVSAWTAKMTEKRSV